jgi:chromosome segregation ATPase
MVPKHSFRKLVIAVLAIFMIAGFLLVDSSAQKRRRRRRTPSPRITNPAIYQPSPGDNTNTNTTGDANNLNSDTNSAEVRPARSTPEQDAEAMKKTLRNISGQVDKLTDRITRMEESQRSLIDLERLSNAEQRAASLRTELRGVQAKEADLEAKAEQIDYDLKPENIERATAGYGTAHPEELRDQRRHQLESERQRLSRQLDQLATGRTRLEEAIAIADTEIDRLRKRLDAADEAAIQNAKTKAQTEGSGPASPPYPSPSPSPTPYPPQ